MSKRRVLVLVVGILLGLIVLGAGGFVIWANDAAPATPEALAAMQSDDLIEFSNQNGWLVFKPISQSDASTPVTTGLVIYPGGKVDYRAYAPVAHDIASHGYLVVVPPVPLNLAFFDENAAAAIKQAFPEIQHWAVAGHSLGGVAASTYAAAHPDQVQGIAFWASYPAGDMHTYPGQVVSISGSNDGLATADKIDASKPNLPPQTTYVVIQGGNHGQFGAYGPQEGDNAATISREEQQLQVADATVAMLESIRAP